MKNLVLAIVVILSALIGLAAQTKKVEVRPAKPTSPASGERMYVAYCAACHGTTGKGDGPAADSLKNQPADLTQLAKKHGGKYPAEYVAGILQGKTEVTPHGSEEMLVWGPVFRGVSKGDEGQVRLRVYNLNKYLESRQSQ
jgi:mono/diheme cytochrome c family protein